MEGLSGAVRSALFLSSVSFSLLALFLPLFILRLSQLHDDLQLGFREVQSMSDQLWDELVSLGREEGISHRVRAVRESFSSRSAASPPSFAPEYADPYAAPVTQPPPITVYYKPPTYGYGYTKLKCCCAFPGYNNEATPQRVSYKCPVGYIGAPGSAGEDGIPGVDGRPGIPGENYPIFQLQSDSYVEAQPCEPCPQGPPGIAGLPGTPGLPGLKGVRGAAGAHGLPGRSGKPGEPGDVGPAGTPGQTGAKGVPGADAVKGGVGRRGAKGSAGSLGVPGPRGVAGTPGDYGRTGLSGPVGQCGPPGPRGAEGVAGRPGSPGVPGRDGLYCPCPPKTSDYAMLKPSYQTSAPPAVEYPIAVPASIPSMELPAAPSPPDIYEAPGAVEPEQITPVPFVASPYPPAVPRSFFEPPPYRKTRVAGGRGRFVERSGWPSPHHSPAWNVPVSGGRTETSTYGLERPFPG